MDRIRSFLFKQYNITGMWLGAFQSQFYATQGIIGAIQFLIILLMAYENNLKPTLVGWLPWMNIGWFIIFGLVGIVVLMVLDFKIILPSRMAYGNYQAAKHKNPIMDELTYLHQQQDMMMAEMTRFKEYMKMDKKGKVAEVVWKLTDNGGEPKGNFEDSFVFKNKCGLPYSVADEVEKLD